MTPENTAIWAGGRHCKACRRALKEPKGEEAKDPKPARTHCGNGHPLTEQNVFLVDGAYRACRVCRDEARARSHARRVAEGKPLPLRRTHCNHGHALTPENVYWQDGVYPVCRTCRLESQRRTRRPAKTAEKETA